MTEAKLPEMRKAALMVTCGCLLTALVLILGAAPAKAAPCLTCEGGEGGFHEETVTATLEIINNRPDHGRVISDDGRIFCGTMCSATYSYTVTCANDTGVCSIPDYATVNLTYTRSSTWAFTGWGGACSGTESCSVVMDGDKSVSASFRDATGPSVWFTKPNPNWIDQLLSGTVSLEVKAWDGEGVSRVDFYVDGNLVGSAPTSPQTTYPVGSSSWDSRTVSDGKATIHAEAVDTSGNVGSSDPLPVIIDNTGPTLKVTGPNNQTFGQGTRQTWQISSTDATSGYADVQCSVVSGGRTYAYGTRFGGDSRFSVSDLPIGSYTFKALATDLGGNQTLKTRQFSIAPVAGIGNVRVKERHTEAIFAVRLSDTTEHTVTMNYATVEGTARASKDYAAKEGKLTFSPGQTTKRIAIHIKGDRLNEPDETFFVDLSGAANAVIGDRRGRGTIVDND